MNTNTATAPFKVVGVCAIVAAGLIAAVIAHDPGQPLVWMIAYLVLVAGVVQYVLGAGQAAIVSADPPSSTTVWFEWSLLNLGHIGVIAGSLTHGVLVLVAGTVLYDLALIWFAVNIFRGPSNLRRSAYILLLLVLFVSSIIGLALSGHPGR